MPQPKITHSAAATVAAWMRVSRAGRSEASAPGRVSTSSSGVVTMMPIRSPIQNWTTLGPRVAHKINVYVGDMDSYYLNDAVENLNAFLSKADNPKWTGEIVFQRRAPHCWGPRAADLLDKMTKQIERYAPAGADTKSWRYR